MKLADWHWIESFARLLATRRPEPVREAERIVGIQLHIVLPAKAGVIAVALYYLFHVGWFTEEQSEHLVVLEFLMGYFLTYLGCNVVAAAILIFWRRFPAGIFQWLVFTLGILDGLFVAGLVFMTGEGFGSIAFWLFPGLIVLNAVSIPLATPQIVLNLLLVAFYFSAGVLTATIPSPELLTLPPGAFRQPAGTNGVYHPALTNALAAFHNPGRTSRTNASIRVSNLPYAQASDALPIKPDVPRIFVLLLLTACCYGVQVLMERQRQALEEAREFAMREGQLHSAGRLAAEFAHQIKNPLAIINNAAFSMQRALKHGKDDLARQIEIIQEEVERSDRILTQILGHAQLSEGRVEKLDVVEELDLAINQVFPPGVTSGIDVVRQYDPPFPPLLMQRRHFSDGVVNLLQNAREALHGRGRVTIFAECLADYSIRIVVADNGPGIPPDKVGRIFEPYYTTKEKGTGLGLAIVKHNAELYSGAVRVESELGKGARFILTFPGRMVINLAKQR